MDLQIAIRIKKKPDQIVFLSSGRNVVFGRGSKVDFKLDDPYVSETHLRVSSSGGRWLATDLGSKHGTIVDGVQYGGRMKRAATSPGDTAFLTHCHTIQLGTTTLDVRAHTDCPEFCDRYDMVEIPTAVFEPPFNTIALEDEPLDLLNTLEHMPIDTHIRTTEYDLMGMDRTVQIGSGPLGVYWKATERLSGKVLAVKSIDCAGWTPASIARIRALYKQNAQLHHPLLPHLCRLDFRAKFLHVGASFIEGEDLAAVTRKCGGRTSIAKAMSLFDSALQSLEALHAADVQHHGIKPTNILITPENKAILLDAGLAHELAAANIISGAQLAGQAAYWPREFFALHDYPDKTCDLFALAAVFFEAMSGTPVRGKFDGLKRMTAAETFQNIDANAHSRPIQNIKSVMPEISDAVARVFERALFELPASTTDVVSKKDEIYSELRSKRYASASELRAALADAYRQA